MEMLLEQLFEDVDRCFEEIEVSRQRIADVLTHTNALCLRHGLLHQEIKQLREEVADSCLELNEKKSLINGVSEEMIALESKLAVLENSLLAKSDALAERELALDALKLKLHNTVSSLKDCQRKSNTKLLKHYEVEETYFRIQKACIEIERRIKSLQDYMEEKSLTYTNELKDLHHENELSRSAISSVLQQMSAVEQDLAECIEEVGVLESAKSLLENKISTTECENQYKCKELDVLADAITCCHHKLGELSKSLNETQESINISAVILSNLDNEASVERDRRESATLMASKLQNALTELCNKVRIMENDLISIQNETTNVSTDVNQSTTTRSHMEKRIDDIRTRAATCGELLSSITNLASSIDKLKGAISTLSNQHAALMEETSSWQTKNATLKNDLDRFNADLRKLQGTKSSLVAAVESETTKSANLTKEVEVLNKEITQSRLLLGDLTRQYELEQSERDTRLKELQQRHLDEYKEKQSVKICDIKADLKSQRESVVQEKRESCSRSLDDFAMRLQASFAGLLKDHQHQLNEDALTIVKLQEELCSIGVDVTN